MKCPNISSPEWKTLEDKVGKEKALYLYHLNGEDIPTITKANELLGINEVGIPVKEGVEELFNKNPELANEVYEAVGITQESTQQSNNTGKEVVQDLSGNTYSVNESDIITYETEFGPIRYITDENGDMVMLSDKNTDAVEDQITPQQKQQAQQLYSQYLDTIFPDSKVKDIVYHHSSQKLEKFDKSFLGKETSAADAQLGFFFAEDKNDIPKMVIEKK